MKKYWVVVASVFGALAVILATALNVFADVPQPVLTIAPLGSNYFSVDITNGVSTTNYTLFWTPALENPLYPWQVLTNGGVGETNFTVDGGEWPGLFFRAMIGSDADGDGVPEWQDAQPLNPNVGVLSITIDSPISGFNFN